MDALRRLRRHELVRIAWRDLAGLAHARRDAARAFGARGRLDPRRARLRECARSTPRYGTPRSAAGEAQELVVIGMGKLGGGELNFSSDIDLIFLYPEQGETDGPREVSNEEYFTRLGQSLIRLLDARTAEGFVFRVDMRLRPLGEPGPLAMNFGAFEDYLQQHGRDWERYAWVKARAVTGAARYGALYDDVVRPFVYRRYLDYRRLREPARDEGDDRPRGRAARAQGQREARAGRHPRDRIHRAVAAADPRRFGAGPADSLRCRRPCRDSRAQSCCPPPPSPNSPRPTPSCGGSRTGCRWWRTPRRTRCPRTRRDARGSPHPMGFADWDAFRAALDARRRAVTARFDDVVLGRGGPEQPPPAARFESLWSPEASLERVTEDVRLAGLAEPDAVARVLLELRQSAYFLRLDEFGRRRLATLLPRVLGAVARIEAGAAKPGRPCSTRLVRIIESIGGRTAYLALLNENAQALERLVQACSMGDYLARQVAAHPLLLDELLDARVLEMLPDRAQFAEELAARLEHAGTDEELRVDALRHFRRAAMFRVAMLDLAGRLPLMQVSDRLTDVAELILEQALALAWRHTAAQYGEPRCDGESGSRDRARRDRRLRQARRHGTRLRLGPRPRVPARCRERQADVRSESRRQRSLLPAARAAPRAPAHGAHAGGPTVRGGRAPAGPPARAASRSRRSTPSRITSGARRGPSSTRRCCTRAGWQATPRSARGFTRVRRDVLIEAVKRESLREDIRRDARAHARRARPHAGRAVRPQA